MLQCTKHQMLHGIEIPSSSLQWRDTATALALGRPIIRPCTSAEAAAVSAEAAKEKCSLHIGGLV